MGNKKICNSEESTLSRRKWSRRWFSFRKSQDGTAAVEFALVSIPFFLILFSILEQGFYFLGNRLIDAGVNQISREVKTRQITADNTSEAQFKIALCAKTLMAIFDCEKLSIDVRTIASFEVPAEPPVLDNGDLDTSGFGFAPGGRSTINVIRAYYDWPTILDWGNIAQAGWGGITGEGMGTNGFRRIVGSAAFLNEP
ncbi:MAG: TadE/TadG family type IV pilus assembly protein [Rhizobiaceae bacterium]